MRRKGRLRSAVRCDSLALQVRRGAVSIVDTHTSNGNWRLLQRPDLRDGRPDSRRRGRHPSSTWWLCCLSGPRRPLLLLLLLLWRWRRRRLRLCLGLALPLAPAVLALEQASLTCRWVGVVPPTALAHHLPR